MESQAAFSLRSICVSLFVLFVLTACAVKVPVTDLPEDLQVEHLGSLSSGSPLVWHPDGHRFALNRSGLYVQTLTGRTHLLTGDNPSAIAWSPTGAYLAASFPARSATTVRIFNFDFSELANIEVDGSVNDLAWVSDAELLIAAVVLKKYSFGGNYQVILHRWLQNEELKSEILTDSSPLTSNLDVLGDAIYDSVHMKISPFRDEILFTRLVMPPNVEMHNKLIVRHLESGAEKVIADIPLGSSGGRYLGSGERIFFSDGLYQSINRSIWGTEPYETYPPGQHLEISPGGRYKIIDQSFLRDRKKLLELDGLDSATFSPDGSSLLFSSDRNLFLLFPLKDAQAQMPGIGIKLLELRRWRSEGLITPLEFEKYYRKLEK